MKYKLTRRTALAGMFAGATLVGCTPSDGSPVALPTPTDVPADCVDLASFVFEHRGHCKPLTSLSDADIVRFDFPGSLVSDGSQLMAYFRNAVLAWDVTSGALTSLHAPQRSDSWVFASRGNATVVPRCNGSLVVHADGCIALELQGHEPESSGSDWVGDGIQSLVFTGDDHLVSLGTDNSLRSWAVSTGEALEMRRLDSRPDARVLWHDAAQGRLVLSHDLGRAVDIYHPTSLQHLQSYPELPEISGGWRTTSEGVLVGINTTDQPNGLTLYDGNTNQTSAIGTETACRAFTVSSTGEIAYEDGSLVKIRATDGTEREIVTQGTEFVSIEFSDNGDFLHVLDAYAGPRTYDVATGDVFTQYELP